MSEDETTKLVRKLRDALLAVESPVDIGLKRRKAIAAANQWLEANRKCILECMPAKPRFTKYN